MLRRTALGLAAACAFALPALPAAAAGCDDAVTTQEMRDCASKSYGSFDNELNAIWQQVMSGLDEAGKGKLRNAQRAWIAFRDADCDAAADMYRGGTFAGVAKNECLAQRTKERAQQLQDLLDR